MLGSHGTCGLDNNWHRLRMMSSWVGNPVYLPMWSLVGQQDENCYLFVFVFLFASSSLSKAFLFLLRLLFSPLSFESRKNMHYQPTVQYCYLYNIYLVLPSLPSSSFGWFHSLFHVFWFFVSPFLASLWLLTWNCHKFRRNLETRKCKCMAEEERRYQRERERRSEWIHLRIALFNDKFHCIAVSTPRLLVRKNWSKIVCYLFIEILSWREKFSSGFRYFLFLY